ncbi:hypothetical protein GO491_06420 [Flavobacteriaceae bacterium Ap0902]|nr:hypothetical protein [Flavobacteriaceae bacterium Ap0902]
MTKEESIGFELVGISTEEFAILAESTAVDDAYELKTGISFKIDDRKHQIGCFVSFMIEKDLEKLLKLKVGCHFIIKLENWNSFINDNDMIIPKGFASHLAMLTVGTARGVYHSKTEHTAFNNFVIPTINVSKFFDSDLILNLKDEEE